MSAQFGSQQQKEAFVCSVCLDEQNDVPHLIQNDPVCADCILTQIVPLFENALHFEHHFPPTWGGEPLKVAHFADVLDSDFVKRYNRIAQEYATPIEDRIYCSHKLENATAPARGAVASRGTKPALSQDQIRSNETRRIDMIACGHLVSGRAHRPNTKMTCYHCNGCVCACGMALDHPSQDHACGPGRIAGTDLMNEGQVRGADFQLCPQCHIPGYLQDGCNAMTCPYCRTQFCFLCGEEHRHNSGHWIHSNCPRFGRTGEVMDLNEVGNDPRMIARQLARGMILLTVARLADREDGLPTEEDHEWVRNMEQDIFDFHGQEIVDLIREELPIQQRNMAAHDGFIAAIHDVDDLVEDMDADDDLIPRLRNLPIMINQNVDAIRNGVMAFIDDNPANDEARGFVERHLRMEEVMQEIQGEELHGLEAFWEWYGTNLGDFLTAVLTRARGLPDDAEPEDAEPEDV